LADRRSETGHKHLNVALICLRHLGDDLADFAGVWSFLDGTVRSVSGWPNMTNNKIAKFAAMVTIALAMTSAASAETDPKACSEQERSNQTLGQELGQSNGVLCPSEVDPGIKSKTPEYGNTPILSPGDRYPNVQPK
jgi:hypothetical protein